MAEAPAEVARRYQTVLAGVDAAVAAARRPPGSVLLLAVSKRQPPDSLTAAYQARLEAVEACILDGAEPLIPLEQSKNFLRSMLALHQSAQTGEPVKP